MKRTKIPASMANELALHEAKPEEIRGQTLSRLRGLLRLRRDHFDELNKAAVILLDRSIYAAYCDCIDIGAGEGARSILRDMHEAVLPRMRSRRERLGAVVIEK